MKILMHTLLFTLFLAFIACSTPPTSFADSFQSFALKDTVLFAVEMSEGATASMVATDTITMEDFNKNVPDSLHEPIAHILDGGDPVIRRLGRVPLNDQFDALAIDIQAFWFRNQSLLVYDTKAKQVIGLFPVAEFYGGDGGQVLIQSWLLLSNKTIKEMIVRNSQHALIIEENAEEPKDVYEESVARYVWQQNKFAEQTISDSAALIQAFPIEWGF